MGARPTGGVVVPAIASTTAAGASTVVGGAGVPVSAPAASTVSTPATASSASVAPRKASAVGAEEVVDRSKSPWPVPLPIANSNRIVEDDRLMEAKFRYEQL